MVSGKLETVCHKPREVSRHTNFYIFFFYINMIHKNINQIKKTFNSAPTTTFFVVGGKTKSKISYYN